MLKRNIFLFLFAAVILPLFSSFSAKKKKRVLVFSKTAGFRHTSIPAGKKALIELGKTNGFIADTTEDATHFNSENLGQYDAVVFLSTTGNVLDSNQQLAFEKFIQSGKGFTGIHAATDTEYDWPWYVGLAGASFESHPQQQTARLYRIEKNHPATAALPDNWVRFDEWYNFKNINSTTHALLNIDESSYSGGKNGDNHVVSWYHEYDGGRAFYTALGHTDASFSEPLFLAHLAGGIKWSLGLK